MPTVDSKYFQHMDAAWKDYMNAVENSLNEIESEINQAQEMASICTDEWCEATEHVLDELHKFVYSIYESPYMKESDAKKLKELRKKIRDMYAKYKSTASAAA